MTKLSVNLNKIALLRNSRGGNQPNLVDYANIALACGADGITIHPRADARHATLDDVIALSQLSPVQKGAAELNVEGDLRDELLRTVQYTRVQQYTVVPVMPGEITSSRGWRGYDDHSRLSTAITQLRKIDHALRISIFVDANLHSLDLARAAGCDAVEFYTGHYAQAATKKEKKQQLEILESAARYARNDQLRIHAGHDLNLDNLPDLLAAIWPDEVSIGHALMDETLRCGFTAAVEKYLCLIHKR